MSWSYELWIVICYFHTADQNCRKDFKYNELDAIEQENITFLAHYTFRSVISAHWATVDWSWPEKVESMCASWSLLLKKKSTGGELIIKTFHPNPHKQEKSHHWNCSEMPAHMLPKMSILMEDHHYFRVTLTLLIYILLLNEYILSSSFVCMSLKCSECL